MSTPKQKSTGRRAKKGIVYRHRVGKWFCSIAARKRGPYTHVLFTSDAEGKRRERWFKTKSAARAEADLLIAKISNHGAGEGEVTRDERSALLYWREWALAQDAPPMLSAFLQEAVKRHEAAAKRTRYSVEDAVQARLKEATDANASKRHKGDLRVRLDRFKAHFSGRDLGDIGTEELHEWIKSLSLAPTSIRNWKKVVGSVFKSAIRRQKISTDPTQAIKAPGAALSHRIVTPRQIDAILHHCPVEARPVFILQAFCGVRAAEALRLTWKNVRIDDSPANLFLPKEVTKTSSSRTIDLLPAALKWLATCDKDKPLAVTEAMYRKARGTASAQAGLEWEENLLRHSFGSYRMMAVRDAGRVASEMGNSVPVVRKHYASTPLTAADAAEYWSSDPVRAERIAVQK